MEYITTTLGNLVHQTAFFSLTWGNVVMIAVACFFLYLAIRHGFEPLLLVPIAFGMLLVNIYPDIMLHAEDASNGTGGLLYYFYKLDEWSILPSLIFLGVGAMTDFGPLIANPKSFLLGAAAQFGIFAAYLGAMCMGFSDKAAAAISIIGGADRPTSIFLAGKLQQTAIMGPIAVAAYSYMSLVPIIQPPIMKLLTTEKERKVMPVNQVNRNVVSSLSASTDNARSFSTAVGTKRTNFKNTISACVASDQSITDGQSVRLRTLEPMWIGNSLLPKNTTVVGAARLQGERLEIKVESIEALGCIMEVDLSVYDSDGQEGINIPNSMESDALHEIGANMGSTMGSSINLTTNAGAQLASDVGKGLINGVSQYLNKKLRTVKVHLKSGYKIMLKQNEQ